MYAIFESGGKQHKVSPGDVIKVERLEAEVGAEVTFKPLMLVDADRMQASTENGALEITAKVTAEGKARKVRVFHKKRRKQYKKTYGHRQPYSQLSILNISMG